MSTQPEQVISGSEITIAAPHFFSDIPLVSVTLSPTLKNLHLGVRRHWLTVYSFSKTWTIESKYNPETQVSYNDVHVATEREEWLYTHNGPFGLIVYAGFIVNIPNRQFPLGQDVLPAIRIESRVLNRLFSAVDDNLSLAETTLEFSVDTVTLSDVANLIRDTKGSYNIDNTESLPGTIADGVYGLQHQAALLRHFAEKGWIDRDRLESAYAKAVAFIQPVDAASQASQT